ncbi:hypothetical protein JTB14_035646 [Gonioctena quinquepunctata]|nr:hypothetical protein JTB14_035646 [Gonioctena quinquepunctata]
MDVISLYRSADNSSFIIHLKLKAPCLSSGDNQDVLDQANNLSILVKSSPEASKLISDVLPRLFGKKITDSSQRIAGKKVSTKSEYKALNIKFKRRSRSVASRRSSDVSRLSCKLDPAASKSDVSTLRNQSMDRSRRSLSSRSSQNEVITLESSSADKSSLHRRNNSSRILPVIPEQDEIIQKNADGNEVVSIQSSNGTVLSNLDVAPYIQLISGRCSGSNIRYSQASKERVSSTPKKISTYFETNHVQIAEDSNKVSSTEIYETARENFEPPKLVEANTNVIDFASEEVQSADDDSQGTRKLGSNSKIDTNTKTDSNKTIKISEKPGIFLQKVLTDSSKFNFSSNLPSDCFPEMTEDFNSMNVNIYESAAFQVPENNSKGERNTTFYKFNNEKDISLDFEEKLILTSEAITEKYTEKYVETPKVPQYIKSPPKSKKTKSEAVKLKTQNLEGETLEKDITLDFGEKIASRATTEKSIEKHVGKTSKKVLRNIIGLPKKQSRNGKGIENEENTDESDFSSLKVNIFEDKINAKDDAAAQLRKKVEPVGKKVSKMASKIKITNRSSEIFEEEKDIYIPSEKTEKRSSVKEEKAKRPLPASSDSGIIQENELKNISQEKDAEYGYSVDEVVIRETEKCSPAKNRTRSTLELIENKNEQSKHISSAKEPTKAETVSNLVEKCDDRIPKTKVETGPVERSKPKRRNTRKSLEDIFFESKIIQETRRDPESPDHFENKQDKMNRRGPVETQKKIIEEVEGIGERKGKRVSSEDNVDPATCKTLGTERNNVAEREIIEKDRKIRRGGSEVNADFVTHRTLRSERIKSKLETTSDSDIISQKHAEVEIEKKTGKLFQGERNRKQKTYEKQDIKDIEEIEMIDLKVNQNKDQKYKIGIEKNKETYASAEIEESKKPRSSSTKNKVQKDERPWPTKHSVKSAKIPKTAQKTKIPAIPNGSSDDDVALSKIKKKILNKVHPTPLEKKKPMMGSPTSPSKNTAHVQEENTLKENIGKHESAVVTERPNYDLIEADTEKRAMSKENDKVIGAEKEVTVESDDDYSGSECLPDLNAPKIRIDPEKTFDDLFKSSSKSLIVTETKLTVILNRLESEFSEDVVPTAGEEPEAKQDGEVGNELHSVLLENVEIPEDVTTEKDTKKLVEDIGAVTEQTDEIIGTDRNVEELKNSLESLKDIGDPLSTRNEPKRHVIEEIIAEEVTVDKNSEVPIEKNKRNVKFDSSAFTTKKVKQDTSLNQSKDLNQTLSTTVSGRRRRKLYNPDDLSFFNSLTDPVSPVSTNKGIIEETKATEKANSERKGIDNTFLNRSSNTSVVSKAINEVIEKIENIEKIDPIKQTVDINKSVATKKTIKREGDAIVPGVIPLQGGGESTVFDIKLPKNEIKVKKSKQKASMNEINYRNIKSHQGHENKSKRIKVNFNASFRDNSSKSHLQTFFEEELASFREELGEKSLLEKMSKKKEKRGDSKSRRNSEHPKTRSKKKEGTKLQKTSLPTAKNRKIISHTSSSSSISLREPKRYSYPVRKVKPKEVQKKKRVFEENNNIPLDEDENVFTILEPFEDIPSAEEGEEKQVHKDAAARTKRKINIISNIQIKPGMDAIPSQPKKMKIDGLNLDNDVVTNGTAGNGQHLLGPAYSMFLVSKPAPPWQGTALLDEEIITIKSTDYLQKYLVLFFYPIDFGTTPYVSDPAEIITFNERIDDFHSINVEVVTCSVDSFFTHRMWVKHLKKEGTLRKLKVPLLSDANHHISKAYQVYSDEFGHTVRGVFIMDPSGIMIHEMRVSYLQRIDVDAIFNWLKAIRSEL